VYKYQGQMNQMSSIQKGRRARALQTFQSFMSIQDKVLPPLEPTTSFSNKFWTALLLIMISSGLTFLGFFIQIHTISYIGMICMILIILGFLKNYS
jgi:hypothetical protein